MFEVLESDITKVKIDEHFGYFGKETDRVYTKIKRKGILS